MSQAKFLVILMMLLVTSGHSRHITFPAFDFTHIGTVQTSKLVVTETRFERTLKSFYLSKNLALSWKNAYDSCKNIGMEMATLNSTQEAKEFLSLCGNKIDQFDVVCPDKTEGIRASIGGMKPEGNWLWLTNDKVIDFTLPWSQGEPKDNTEDEFCLGINAVDGVFGVASMPCYTGFFPFICQVVQKIV